MKRLTFYLASLLLILAAARIAAAPGTLEPPRKISGGIFTVEFWPGDEKIANESLEILRETASDFSRRLPAGDRPVRVTICRSIDQFRAHAGQYGRAWVGGVTKSRSGRIAVKAPYLLPESRDYYGLLRHELLHVLLARNVREEYLPRWFNEGVVMVLSGENRWGSAARVAGMYASRNLIPYYNLDFGFLPLGDEVLSGDAYAQAYSMTRFLQDRIGEERFWELVAALRHTPFDTALSQATGMTPGEFYNTWRGSLWKVALISASASAFSAFNLMILLVFLAWYRKRRRNIAILEQWEQEEMEEAAWHNEYASPVDWLESTPDCDEERW